MIEALMYRLGFSKTHPVFVIGTGRSGTHWLGYALKNHPEVRATVEAQPMFGLSTQIALNPTMEKQLLPRLVNAYKKQLRKTSRRLYLDKSHPNIWIAEQLQAEFPEALFVGIERDPYATVASMMKHAGVSSWHHRWKEFPLPNRFLGIDEGAAASYESLPFAAKCAMRWIAHHQRMEELMKFLGDRLFVISYESFATETRRVIEQLSAFLDCNSRIPEPVVKTESLQKWKSQLTNEEIQQIERIVGFSPGEDQ